MEMHQAGSVCAASDFGLPVALGHDLPGAVRVVPATPVDHCRDDQRKIQMQAFRVRCQMKLSVIHEHSMPCSP